MRNKTALEESLYTVLNPVAQQPSKKVQGINPRLDTLKGKTVNVINLHGGNEAAIESVGPALQAAVPDCNVVPFRTDGGFGGYPLTDEDWANMLNCDAAILGHNY